jgi:hypothetical protein
MDFGLERGLVFNGARLPDFGMDGQEIISRSLKKIGTPSPADIQFAAENPPNATIFCLKRMGQTIGYRICAK